MTPRLKNTSTHLLTMSSHRFAAPSANVPVRALIRLLLDPIKAFEYMLEPQGEAWGDIGEESTSTVVRAETMLTAPIRRSSAMSSKAPVSIPRDIPSAKIVQHSRPLSVAPKITMPATRRPAPARLIPFQTVRTAKSELAPAEKQTTNSATPGEFTSVEETLRELPSEKQPDPTPPVNSTTRMIQGSSRLTSLLTNNVRKTANTSPPALFSTSSPDAIRPLNFHDELSPAKKIELPGKAVTRAIKPAGRESTRKLTRPLSLEPVAAFENPPAAQMTSFPAPAQQSGPATSSATSPTTQTAVNYDEILDELERRLAVEFLRHYGTSGV